MNILFLGTGTSVGVPVIGCACPVCTSGDPRNWRLRAGAWLRAGSVGLLIDVPPDFRTQALTFGVDRVDAILFTHAHADHIMGLDDIRRFNTIQEGPIPAYGSEHSIADLKRVFNYIGNSPPLPGLYRPQIDFHAVRAAFAVGRIRVLPVPVEHGGIPTFGFRFDAGRSALGYCPDCHSMDDAAVEAFRGVDVMILDALRFRPHRTHLTLPESLALLQRIGAARSYLIHMCHDVDHAAVEAGLPPSVRLAYDGLRVPV